METQAKLAIQQMIKDGKVELVWSDVLSYENCRNPFAERMASIADWQKLSVENVALDDGVIAAGRRLLSLGLKNMDALHISSAMRAGSKYFITVDKGILKKNIDGIKIRTPYGFLEEVLK